MTRWKYNITSVSPSFNEQQALGNALNFVNAKKYKWEDEGMEKFVKQHTGKPNASYYPQGEVVIAKDALIDKGTLKLAWKFNISSLEPNDEQLIYVDANSGDVIDVVSLICDANTPATAGTRYSSTQTITTDSYPNGFRLMESRNGVDVHTMNLHGTFSYGNAIEFDNTNTNWISGSWVNFSPDRVALDAHWGAEKVLDYWRSVHNRNSLDGASIRVLSYVHAGSNWSNGQWVGGASNRFMQYGDGDGSTYYPLTSLDFCAHELGHGINEFTANLTPGNMESGALNEGFSDIWATCVESWAAVSGKQTWRFGEEVINPSSGYNCGRDLQNPRSTTASEGQHTDTYQGQFWRSDGEPHFNSTVLSHWFYLLTIGGNGRNDGQTSHASSGGYVWTVNGIGINKAERIAFRALSMYLNSSANYTAARTATILAVKDLFCDNSQEVAAVTNAWYAVGVGAAFNGTLANITGTEPICTTSTFIASNQPAGVTNVTWTSNNTSALTVNPATGLATRVNNFNGVVNLNATFTGQGNCNTILTKTVIVGTGILDPLFTQKTVSCPTGRITIIASVTPAPGTATYKWYIDNVLQKTTTYSTGVSVASGYPDNLYHTLRCDITNSCNLPPVSTANQEGRFRASCTGGGGGTFTVYPNPASTELSVEFFPDATVSSTLSTQSTETVSATVSSIEFSVKMINSSNQTVLTGNSLSGKISLDTHNLQPGLYYLNINKNGEITTEQILVKK